MSTPTLDSCNIRVANEQDRAGIVALWGQVFANPPAHNNPDDDIDRKFAKDPGLFLVAEAGPDASQSCAIIGTCMAGWDGHRGAVWYVGVLDQWQGRGIGRALMQQAEKMLWQQGARKVNLVIRGGNDKVAAFYERLGYSREDRIYMGKLLNEHGNDDSELNALRQKAETFRRLHQRPQAFVIPNPWDLGSSKILQSMGFEALATTSAGFAYARGNVDGQMNRDSVLAHCRELATQTPLPVSADFENGFANDLNQLAHNYTLAGQTGLVGASIEDASGDPTAPIYPFDEAVARVEAAVDAVKKLPFPFVLTARAENYLFARPDLEDTLRRLQAFERAGADVLYAPGLKDIDDIATICSNVTKPVNVVIGNGMAHFTVDQLSKAGVSRISLGSSFARVAIGALITSARQSLEHGRFDMIADATSFSDIGKLLK